MSDNQRKMSFTLGGISMLAVLMTFLFVTGITFNRNHPPQPSPSLSHLVAGIESEQVNLDRQKQPFKEGVYYSYGPSSEDIESDGDGQKRISHPELILGFIAGQGADLQEAWYRSYSSSCSPPGSNMAMDVIVPPKLLIRVGSPLSDAQLKRSGLTKVDNPSMSSCPYYVRHYTFNNNKR